MATCAANKKLHLVAALCLALVAAAAATGRHAAAVKPECKVPNDVADCVKQIKDLSLNNGGVLLSPNCCKQLTEQLGCACLVRNALKDANLLDIQKPFCVKGTACE